MEQTPDDSLTTLQIVATVIFTVTSSISLLAYLLVIIVLILYFKEFKTNFYAFIISLAVADMAYLLLILLYVVPCTVLQKHLWAPYDYVAGLIECGAYITQCVHLTFIGFNRLAYAYVTTTIDKTLERVFNSVWAITFWISLLWVLGIATACCLKLIGCDLIYHYEVLDFWFDCRYRVSMEATERAKTADAIISGLLPVLVTVLHVLTWAVLHVKRKRSTNANTDQATLQKRRKIERNTLIQFSLISSMLLAFYSSFWIIPHVLPGSRGSVIITMFGIVSSGINPFTYLIWNKLLKIKAKYLIFEVIMGRKNLITPAPTEKTFAVTRHPVQVQPPDIES